MLSLIIGCKGYWAWLDNLTVIYNIVFMWTSVLTKRLMNRLLECNLFVAWEHPRPH